MKRIIIAVLAMLTLPSAMANFKEGTHFEVVRQTATAKPEVIEFFSYYCPHCFRFEPVAEEIKASLPDGVSFKKNHVSFLGGPMGEEMARAYATAEVLKTEKTFSAAMFDAIHRQGQRFSGRDDIRKIFVASGVDGADVDAASESFVVNGMLAQMDKNTMTYQIRGVPAVVVNGKYQVNTGSVKSVEELVELVNFLVAKND